MKFSESELSWQVYLEWAKYVFECVNAKVSEAGVCFRLYAIFLDEKYRSKAGQLIHEAKSYLDSVEQYKLLVRYEGCTTDNLTLLESKLRSLQGHIQLLEHWDNVSQEVHTRAFKLFEQAEVYIKGSDTAHSHSERAKIDLLRADALICRANNAIVDQAQNTSYSSWRRDRQRFILQDASGVAQFARDSIRYSLRAGKAFRERRRNVEWTSVYSERLIRAANILIWCTPKGEVVPYVGPESRRMGDPSSVEKSVNTALRLAVYDEYRVASIVDAYCECIEALTYRRSVLDEKEWSWCLDYMEQSLTEYRVQLEETSSRDSAKITEWNQHSPSDRVEIMDVVTTYVKGVRDRVDCILRT